MSAPQERPVVQIARSRSRASLPVAQAIVFCRLRGPAERGRPQTAMVCPTQQRSRNQCQGAHPWSAGQRDESRCGKQECSRHRRLPRALVAWALLPAASTSLVDARPRDRRCHAPWKSCQADKNWSCCSTGLHSAWRVIRSICLPSGARRTRGRPRLSGFRHHPRPHRRSAHDGGESHRGPARPQ